MQHFSMYIRLKKQRGRQVVSVELIVAAQNGEQEALVSILRAVEPNAYKTAVYLLGNRQDALDATQETLIRISRSIYQYENRALFHTWVHRIVTNLCYDHLRRRQEQVSIDSSELVLSTNEQVEDQVLKAVLVDDVQRAIYALQEPYRSIVVLRYVHQLSYEEVAETTELPLNTVKSHLFRAKTKLQQLLSDYKKGGELR
jgi:RNA polymerase sigma factor (sigma-70 family)